MAVCIPYLLDLCSTFPISFQFPDVVSFHIWVYPFVLSSLIMSWLRRPFACNVCHPFFLVLISIIKLCLYILFYLFCAFSLQLKGNDYHKFSDRFPSVFFLDNLGSCARVCDEIIFKMEKSRIWKFKLLLGSCWGGGKTRSTILFPK